MTNRQEALKLISKADKKSKPGLFGRIMGTVEDQLNSANEYYTTAINLLKMDRPVDYDLVISIYHRKISNSKISCSNYDIISDYAEIGRLCEKLDRYNDAINAYLQAIEYSKCVDINHVKRYMINIAKIYQKQNEPHKAIEYYTSALSIDEDHYSYGEMARLYCELAEYELAMENYVNAAKLCSDTIKRWTGRDYYVNASLCGFCLKGLGFTSTFEQFQEDCASLPDHPLIKAVLTGLRTNDVEHFRDALAEHDSLTNNLTDLQVKLLLAIRQKIEAQDELM